MAKMTFRVDATSYNRTRTDVKADGFTMIIDEPAGIGGTGMGPSPLEYLLGSLAGCMNFAGHLIASEMGIELESLKILIEGDLDPMVVMGKKKDARAGFREIRVQVDVRTSAAGEMVEKWIRAVEERCPVSDTIRNATSVRVSLNQADASENLKNVLFLCTGNSARSQMAEGLVNHLLSDRVRAFSAGVEPARINPYAVKVMSEIGIDISGHEVNHPGDFDREEFDYLITLCDHARETCPVVPGMTVRERMHMGFPDPASITGTEEEILKGFREVRDLIREELLRYFKDTGARERMMEFQ